MAASLWVILTIEKLAFVCINCNKSWCLNHTNFSRQINKINFQMMTDKDTKCLITKAKQDMMPQTPDHGGTLLFPSRSSYPSGILSSYLSWPAWEVVYVSPTPCFGCLHGF